MGLEYDGFENAICSVAIQLLKQFVGPKVPDHVAYTVLEADNLGAIARYLNSIAIVQEFKITPVQNLSDIIQFGKEAMAKATQE